MFDKPDITLHIVPQSYFEAQPQNEDYQPEPMATGHESFIHCTDGVQNLLQVANRFYTADPRDFIVLLLDKSRITAPVIYEDPGNIYPHIYGKLNRNAILQILPVKRSSTGEFIEIPTAL